MARKPNYGFEKRRKELERKQKQDAKVERRAEEARQRANEEAANTPQAPDAESEPLSP